jgi:hypothetical protein
MKKLILIILVCLLAACVQQKASDITPNNLLGMDIIWMEKGKKALETVEKSHIGNIEFIEDVAITGYRGDGKSITLWVTTYPNSTIAKKETERMAQAMLHFEDWGVNLKKDEVDGVLVYSTLKDVTHYFWSEERCMFYIIPKNLNQTEVRHVIEILKCDSWIWPLS